MITCRNIAMKGFEKPGCFFMPVTLLFLMFQQSVVCVAQWVECTEAAYLESPSPSYPMGRFRNCTACYAWHPDYGWVPIAVTWDCAV